MTEETEVDLGISVGMRFMELSEFQERLKCESKMRCVQLYINSSRTVEAARNKIKRYLNPELRFYSVNWACIHGGRQYKSRGKGIRKTMTLRREQLCPAHVHVIISDTGNDFIVSSVNNKHNHIISQKLFKQLPHNRKLLSASIKADTKKLTRMKANKQMIHVGDEERLDQCTTMKDLRTICHNIQSKFGADCHLLLDSDDVFKGLTFFTNEMISSMSAFPEYICIDATYKLLNVKVPVYVIFNVDGNGESGIVAVAVLMQDDMESLKWFLETFKNCNPSWNKIQNIMSNKDFTEQEVFNEIFPSAELHICIFDVLKVFQQELTCEKFRIASSVRIRILELLQELVYSENEMEFDETLETIRSDFPERIYRYLSDYWIDIKEEWCPFLGNKVNNFMNGTNNRLEGINSKFKAICQKHSTFEQFIDEIFKTIHSLEKEKNTRMATFLNKRKTTFYPPGDFRSSYFQLLTPYAFKKLEKQFSYTNVSFSIHEDLQYYTTEGKKCEFNTTTTSCTCYFATSLGMPCKHIFAVRNDCMLNLFQPELVIDRWKNVYYLQHCAVLHDSSEEDISATSQPTYGDILPDKNRSTVLTGPEKYKKTFAKAKLIATLASGMCGNSYDDLNDVLDRIVDNLQSNNYNFDVVTKTNCNADITTVAEDGDTEMNTQIVYLDVDRANSGAPSVIKAEDSDGSYNLDIIPLSYNEYCDSKTGIIQNSDVSDVCNVKLENSKVPLSKRRGRTAQKNNSNEMDLKK